MGKFSVNPLPVRPNQPRLTKIAELNTIDSAKRPQTNLGHKFEFWSDIARVESLFLVPGLDRDHRLQMKVEI